MSEITTVEERSLETKAWESRLRRLADKLGYHLSKSGTRNRDSAAFGRYTLIGYENHDVAWAPRLVWRDSRFLTLDDVENYLYRFVDDEDEDEDEGDEGDE